MDNKADLLQQVKAKLRDRRGEWRQIAEASGVPYFTLAKVASGATDNPRWQTLSRLAEHLEQGAA
ncbi:hypothetical protein [Microbulbifer celer]|uniref:HTH cro/C1-type domain-containing protein n=1 Tax=Microbulbifer celer TaxID=435905 RepID=A0ABW3UA80_9GAMM|nr:hypothetical protein [Microbulbifer celer]UFN58556.1 hypothetical protein LPW13_05805 [Microbulbifer celer]